MAICLDRAVRLVFRIWCVTLCRLSCLQSVPIWCLGHDVEFDCIVSDHCLSIYFDTLILYMYFITRRSMLSLTLFLLLSFVSVLFSIVITSLGKERMGMYSFFYLATFCRCLGVRGRLRLMIVTLLGY